MAAVDIRHARLLSWFLQLTPEEQDQALYVGQEAANGNSTPLIKNWIRGLKTGVISGFLIDLTDTRNRGTIR